MRDMEYTLIAKITKPFGIKGEVKAECYTDFPEERFRKGTKVYLGDKKIPMEVKSWHFHKGILLLLFEGYEDINLIEGFRDYEVYKDNADIKPLKKGEYYFSDIEGLDVYQGGKKVGHVSRMEEGTMYNYMRIKKEDGKEALVPFRENFVLSVDLEAHKLEIVELEGLL